MLMQGFIFTGKIISDKIIMATHRIDDLIKFRLSFWVKTLNWLVFLKLDYKPWAIKYFNWLTKTSRLYIVINGVKHIL